MEELMAVVEGTSYSSEAAEEVDLHETNSRKVILIKIVRVYFEKITLIIATARQTATAYSKQCPSQDSLNLPAI